jgi:hypothetical protein
MNEQATKQLTVTKQTAIKMPGSGHTYPNKTVTTVGFAFK